MLEAIIEIYSKDTEKLNRQNPSQHITNISKQYKNNTKLSSPMY